MKRKDMSSGIEESKNQIVTKLSNYLKLPKAQRWICCEWFYSDIDKVIFESENDFSLCIKQSFPRLKTRKLRRKQWCILRSLIGKPRRCSDAFFQEERIMLEEKRQKIRLIQQRKVSEKELVDYQDLPQEIPLTLSIGNRVYAHICRPEEGVFLGTIAAVDPCDHTYRVVFDRASLGSQTVYDYEIKSVTPVQTIPIRAYIQTYRPKINSNTSQVFLSQNQNTPKSNVFLTPNAHQSNPINLLIDDLNSINAMNNPAFAALLLQSNLDPMLGISSPIKLDNLNEITSQCVTPLYNSGIISNAANGSLGGFPIRLLLMITRLNKILNIKRETVSKLDAMNKEAERTKANNEEFTKEFQTNYAIIVLDLEKLNKDLSDYLHGVQRYCEEFAPEFKITSDDLENSTENSDSKINDIKHNLFNESSNLITKLNSLNVGDIKAKDNNTLENKCSNDTVKVKKRINSRRIISLITKLTSLFHQLREYVNSTNQSNTENGKPNGIFLTYYSQLINESIAEIKESLSSERMTTLFEDKIQVHLNYIQSTLCYYNRLHAFKYELNIDGLDEKLLDSSQKSNNLEEDMHVEMNDLMETVDDGHSNNLAENIEIEDGDKYENEAGTDDSFDTTRKFADEDCSTDRIRLQNSVIHKHKNAKKTETKHLNSLNNFKTVICSNSSLS